MESRPSLLIPEWLRLNPGLPAPAVGLILALASSGCHEIPTRQNAVALTPLHAWSDDGIPYEGNYYFEGACFAIRTRMLDGPIADDWTDHDGWGGWLHVGRLSRTQCRNAILGNANSVEITQTDGSDLRTHADQIELASSTMDSLHRSSQRLSNLCGDSLSEKYRDIPVAALKFEFISSSESPRQMQMILATPESALPTPYALGYLIQIDLPLNEISQRSAPGPKMQVSCQLNIGE